MDAQFFISPFFYQNPHSFSINGIQLKKFNPGFLLESAITNKFKNYQKCSSGLKTDFVIYLYLNTFYNPLMTTIYSDLSARIYNQSNGNYKNLLVKFKNISLINNSIDSQLVAHYEQLVTNLDNHVRKLSNKNKNKIDGKICKVFY